MRHDRLAVVIPLFLSAAALATPASPYIERVVLPAGSTTDPSPYVAAMTECLSKLDRAVRAAGLGALDMRIKTLNIKQSPIASGSAGTDEVDIAGPADSGAACHEAFHVFQLKGWTRGIFDLPRVDGKTTPLFEAGPQFAAVVMTGDCLVGRVGRGDLAYDHCRRLEWDKVPSLAATGAREVQLMRAHGWDKLAADWENSRSKLPAETRARPSAYYTSVPLGFALQDAFGVCDRDRLLAALVHAWWKGSLEQPAKFASVKTFTALYLQSIRKLASAACADRIAVTATDVGLDTL